MMRSPRSAAEPPGEKSGRSKLAETLRKIRRRARRRRVSVDSAELIREDRDQR